MRARLEYCRGTQVGYVLDVELSSRGTPAPEPAIWMRKETTVKGLLQRRQPTCCITIHLYKIHHVRSCRSNMEDVLCENPPHTCPKSPVVRLRGHGQKQGSSLQFWTPTGIWGGGAFLDSPFHSEHFEYTQVCKIFNLKSTFLNN